MGDTSVLHVTTVFLFCFVFFNWFMDDETTYLHKFQFDKLLYTTIFLAEKAMTAAVMLKGWL